jgi:hypothetical protein
MARAFSSGVDFPAMRGGDFGRTSSSGAKWEWGKNIAGEHIYVCNDLD